jgi:hypothetical protein
LPYTVDLPAGWVTYNLNDPAAQTSLNAYLDANPQLAGAASAFMKLPNVSMNINTLLGTVFIVAPVPSNGASLATIEQSLTAQFQAVPGVDTAPVPEDITLPIGKVAHWNIEVSSAKPGGGTLVADESVYLAVNSETALIAEFVALKGAGVADESTIIQTLRWAQ